MSGGVACRACGVILPGRVGRCPSCGARSGRRRVLAAWVGLAVVGVLVVLVAPAVPRLLKRPRVDPALAGDVKAYTGIRGMSRDFTRIEVSGFIDNNGKVPVDVIVRVRVFDVVGHVHDESESGPYRNIAAGDSRPVKVILDMIPVENVEIDVVELSPTPR